MVDKAILTTSMAILKINPNAKPAEKPVNILITFVLCHNPASCPASSTARGEYPEIKGIKNFLCIFLSIFVLLKIEKQIPIGTPRNIPKHLAHTGI